MLYKHLSTEVWRAMVPTRVLEQLQDAYRKQSIRSLRIQGQINQLLTKANDLEIPIILLKGAALAGWLYEDIALRPMNDIDILCKDEDISRIDQMLRILGYSQNTISYPSHIHQLMSTERRHLRPYSRKQGVCLEVHTRLFEKAGDGQNNMEHVWNNALKMGNGSNSPWVLSYEWMLLHLCLHFHRHFQRHNVALYWLSDLVEFVNKLHDTLDWKMFWRLANGLSGHGKILDVFTLLYTYLGVGAVVADFERHAASSFPLDIRSLLNVEPDALERRWFENLIENKRKEFKDVSSKYGLIEGLYFEFRTLFPKRTYMLNRYGETSGWRFLRCYLLHIHKRFRNAIMSVRLSLR